VQRTEAWDSCVKDICSAEGDRNTPLIYAAQKGNVEMVRVLLEGGANTERGNVQYTTALDIAALNGYLDVCRVLLDWGANVDPLDSFQNTPLHHASWKGHFSVVKLLVERGANVRLKNKNKQNPSEVARSAKYKEIANWLDSVSRG
jgi:ankyrin repeat protein